MLRNLRENRKSQDRKKNGQSIVIFTNQQCKIKDGWLYFSRRVNLEPIRTRIKESNWNVYSN